MGLADIRATRQQAIEEPFGAKPRCRRSTDGRRRSSAQDVHATRSSRRACRAAGHRRRIVRAHMRYAGTDTALRSVDPHGAPGCDEVAPSRAAHRARFGFIDETKRLVVEAVSVEAVGGGAKFTETVAATYQRPAARACARTRDSTPRGDWHDAARLPARPARARPPDRGPGDHHRAAPDRRRRGRLAGRDHREEPSRARTRRAARARSTRSARRPIR